MHILESPSGEVNQGVGSALRGSTTIILQPRSEHSLQGGRQVRAALLVEPPINDPHPIRTLTVVQPAPLVSPVLVGQESFLVELAAEALGKLAQPTGVELLGCLNRAALELGDRLGSDVAGGPGDYCRLSAAALPAPHTFPHNRPT